MGPAISALGQRPSSVGASQRIKKRCWIALRGPIFARDVFRLLSVHFLQAEDWSSRGASLSGGGDMFRAGSKEGLLRRSAPALLVLMAMGLLAMGLLPGPGASLAREAATTAAAPASKPVTKQNVKKPAKKAARKKPVPAKKLFGAKRRAAALSPRAIGFYTHGCLAGGEQLPVTGPAWQAMRLSRNRNWGHPVLVNLVKRLATEAKTHDGWNGLLVGDMAQPRGGPMLSGHQSHQVGLDADIWLRQMPSRVLSRKQREKFPPISMLKNSLDVNPRVWTEKHLKLIRRAASYPEVERIFVNRAIKYKLCQSTEKGKRAWLSKVRPWSGHHYHMHIRIKCPAGNAGCKAQKPPANNDGCSYIERWHRNLKAWLALPKAERRARIKKRKKHKRKPRKRRVFTMDRLPAACRLVLNAPDLTPAGRPKLVRAPAKATRPDVSNGLSEARAIMGKTQ